MEALLNAHQGTATLRAPPIGDFDLFPDERPGAVIGRYKLLQKIGEGGCGVVWVADQEEPVRRRVALKVIKPGMDTHEVTARFAAEQQALAMMDHPSIAKVLDAGTTSAGRPFFVMELVPGVRITDYCDRRTLSIAARLELFIQVCHAVQHAHQKGIIHRDLKPSNVLVTDCQWHGTAADPASDDARDRPDPLPKVIDFGIAKATRGRLVDGTLVTAFDQFIGTPAYMSPEQANMDGLNVDTRSDVYSLGVLLYEVLVGGAPFDPKSLNKLDRDEIRRFIREKDPPKPSARIAGLPLEERERLARLRGTDPARLKAWLAGDLDWIVMKAIEKEPDRRYVTANAFAADLTRHLNHEPVIARPPSAAYRAAKLIRRNRLAVAGAAAIALTLVTSTVVSTSQAVRARQAEAVANAERLRVLDERGRADDLLAFMLTELRPKLETVGRLDLLDAVGDKALKFFAGLDPNDSNDVRLGHDANSLAQIGLLRIDQARYAEAEQAFAGALARAQALIRRNERDLGGFLVRARAEFGHALLDWKRGRLEAANEWFSRQRATATILISRAPDNPECQREIVTSYHNSAAFMAERGQSEKARERFQAEIPLLERLIKAAPADLSLRIQVADAHSWLGSLAEHSGDFGEAIRRFREQTRHLEELSRLEPRTAHWRFKLSDSLAFQSTVFAITGQMTPAREALMGALSLMEPLARSDPGNQRWRHAWLGLKLKAAALAKSSRAMSEAEALLASVREGYEELTAAAPSNRGFTLRLATTLRLQAELRHAAAQPDAAALADRALQVAEKPLLDGRDKMQDVGEYASACVLIGTIAAAGGELERAQSHWRKARQALARRMDDGRDWRLLDPDARAAALMGETEQARAIISRLTRFRYVPLEPWPDFDGPPVTTKAQP